MGLVGLGGGGIELFFFKVFFEPIFIKIKGSVQYEKV
jgi:hypothetical protein